MLRLGGAHAMDGRVGVGDRKGAACRTAAALTRAGSAGRVGAFGSDARRRQAAPASNPAADGGRAGEATRGGLSAVRPLQAKIIDQRVPAPLVPVCIRQGADPRAAIDLLSLSGRA